MFWDLWHDTSDRDNVMTLMYGKLKIVEFSHGKFGKRYPPADAFIRMTRALKGVKSIRQLPVPEAPSTMLFEADCGSRGEVLIAWKLGNLFAEEPADTGLEWDWPAATCVAQDALGASIPVKVGAGKVSVMIGATPVFLSER